MDVSALRRCVGDVDLFLEKYWARAPLLRVGAVARFDTLASLDDLDRMVSSLGLRESALRMVKDGKTLPPGAYTSSPSTRSRAKDAAANAALVFERFEEGATIVLEGLHRYWEPLTEFCRELEIALGHRLQVNAYITPPGAQGFDVHSDDHDVFVLQIWGSKHWIVYERNDDDRNDDDRVLLDEVIEPGTSLYIPKGFPHAATTGEAASAHLTVGILTHNSSDVLKEIVHLASEEPIFRDRIDVRDAETLAAEVDRHVEELRTWLDKLDRDELTTRLARKVFTTAQPMLRGQLRQLDALASIDGSTIVRRRRGATCTLRAMDGEVRVLLADRELSLPPMASPALDHMTSRERFAVSELHPSLDPESALVLVRRLVREGLLEVVFDA